MNPPDKPIVLITGAAGNIGRSLAAALAGGYRVVGLDKPGTSADFPLIEVDFTDDESVRAALGSFRNDYGRHIASVIHLVAYFDFTGEENPLYREVNVEGTRRLLRALQDFEVEQFVYALAGRARRSTRISRSRRAGPIRNRRRRPRRRSPRSTVKSPMWC
jgi:nucleoside-diphosphate-sugar epimerase